MRSFIKNSILSGYRHHSYAMEREISDYFLKGRGDSSLGQILGIDTYADVLGPEKLRAMKNALICLVTVMSRSAINNGVDTEISFSMSDYFVNEIEKQQNAAELQALLEEIIQSFREQVEEEQFRRYPLYVARAMRYIHTRIYDTCTVAETAAFAGCNPQYLASLFQKELGESPGKYICRKKMEAASDLLLVERYPVNEVSDILGYCNTSHFIRGFKQFYQMTPKQYALKNIRE